MTPDEREKLLAKEAEQILGSAAFQEACNVFVSRAMKAWAAGELKSFEDREEAYRRVQAFNAVTREMVAMVESYKLKTAQSET